jgi:hypothetical protein
MFKWDVPALLNILYIYVTLKEGNRSMSEKNNQNALWQYQNSHDMKFRVVDVL